MPTKNKNEFWVNAETIMKMTGLTKADMFRLRKNNPSWWDRREGKIVYDLNLIPESMIKKVTV